MVKISESWKVSIIVFLLIKTLKQNTIVLFLRLILHPPKRTMPGSHKITNELGCRLGEKSPRSGVLSPAPCEKYAKEELNILQLNINGLQNKKIEPRPRSTYCTLARNNPTKKKKQKSPSEDTLKSHVPPKKPTAPTVKAS